MCLPLLLFLILVSNIICGQSAMFGVDLGQCPDDYVRCPCGKQPNALVPKVAVPVKRCSYFHRYKMYCKPCAQLNINEVCRRFENCETCDRRQGTGCETCPAGTYGILCENNCTCFNGGHCRPDGSCICPEPFTGPQCQNRRARECSDPPAPPHGNVTVDSRTEGSVAKYNCRESYVLIGSSSSVCLPSGQWSQGTPTCEYECQVPEPAENMRIEVIPTLIQPPGIAHEVRLVRELNLSCRRGYEVSGERNVRCLPNGVWNTNFPTCVPSCGQPPQIPYGSRIIDNVVEGSVVVYRCDEGYRHESDETITCVNGEWLPSIPRCIRWIECPLLTDIAHGSLQINSTTRIPGSIVEYSCNPGFRLEGGAAIRTCSVEGRWSGIEPWCTRDIPDVGATCTTPEVPTNGRVLNQQNVVAYITGIRITFGCLTGYILMGNNERTCSDNGTWTGQIPRCIEVITCNDPGIPSNTIRHELNPRVKYGRGSRLPSIVLRTMKRSRGPKKTNLVLPEGKFRVYTTLKYKCESQFYKLVGSRKRRCASSGEWTGRQPVCIPICGKSATARRPLIYNGTVSNIGQWPWQAAISHKLLENYWYVGCGGSLLSETVVVTAAHCVTLRGTSSRLSAQKIKVHLGKHHRDNKNDDQFVQTLQVEDIEIHPSYKPSTFDYDIAVLRLATPVTLTDRVSPVCLPSQHQSQIHLRPGSDGVVTGWGRTEEDKDSLELRMTSVQTITNSDCIEKYAQTGFPQTITGNMFCAGRDDGSTDSCEGDSGGPLVFPQDAGHSRTWFLEGVVSWGSPLGCGIEMQYGVYTKISHCIDWLINFV